MSRSADRVRPSPVHLVAGALVLAGLALTAVSWWFFLLVGAGAFGPSLLREIGWLDDLDEFQLQASRRAGHHAYLVGGLLAVALVPAFRSGADLTRVGELPTLFLAVLWSTWFFRSLLDYWGPRKTASRVLFAFGTVWLVFNVIANTGSEWTGPTALLMQSLLALPFFALGWLARRFPRIAGGMLLATSGFFFWFFDMFGHDTLSLATQGVVFVLFIGPLLTSGLALLAYREEDDEEGLEAVAP